ncbi:transglutaminase domain-containing protein [Endozoicomonas sp. SESOKO1]|uniref:transglutaminase domain-containing protein n=1 Tax=Endozoicomonas sp. SESOKO1 TaxID=2828742 RepID=UPI002147CFEC|nr:transglutaminase domain-containing protein [Endozoicomonas sp. SESOKO1]
MNAHEKVPGVSFVGRFPLRPLTGGNKTSGRKIPEEKVPLLQKLQEECASPRVPRSERRPIQSFAIVATDVKSASISNNPVKFDCVIIPPDAGVDGLLDRLSTFEHQRSQHGEAGAEIHLIQSFEDLSKDNLRQRIHLKEGGGKCQRSPGKLFENNRPIRLVVDLQKMNPNDTVALNDLLDPENPTLNKIRLGSHVEILVLVQKKQLHAGNTYSLGADTCRRINRVENTWDYQKKLASLTSTHEQHRFILDLSPCATDENNPEASSINLCHGNVPWRQLLLGSYGVNTDRGFGWKAGVLEKEKPKTLCITDAPDGDLAFTQALRNIKITGEIEVKGEKVSLPEDMNFLIRHSGNEDRSRLLSSIKLVSNIPDGPLITINSANFNNWLSTVGINARGESCEHNPLEEAIQAGGSIMVTSSLKEAQWTQLLHRLASIVDVHKTKIPLTLLATRQPPSFFPASPDRLPQLAGDAFDQMIKVQRSPDQEALVNELCNRHPEAEIVRVNPETTLSQLVNNPHIVSEARYRYGFRWSGMMKALNANKPVILCGLEQNPRLQLELETLLLKPGHFFINGSKEQIPADSRIYLVWPEGARTESMVWQSAIENEVVVTLPVAEQSLARNRLKAGLGKLQSALKTLPEKFSTIKLPPLSDALVQSVLNEVNAIVAQEGSAEALPVHYRKAISTVVTHVARENSQVRAFAKSITRQIWPDRPRDGYWVDIDKLTAFLGDGHRIDRNYIASNGWELVDMFGEGFFAYPKPMALDFNQSGHKETLIALICRHAPKIYQRALKHRLKCNDKVFNELPDATYRSSVITRILNNALYAGWAFCKQQGIPTQTRLDNLSTRILDIQKNTPANQQQTVIRSLLKRHFIINGVDDDQAVLDQILSKRLSQSSSGLRRLARLKRRIQGNKLITLEGSTGTGKSYLAHQAAKSSGPTFTLTIGPSAEESHLLKRWVWQQQGDDRGMKEQAEIILKWARTVPGPGEMVTLVVDEANLAAELLDNVLAGIWSDNPHIFCGSESVDISPRHRVVFTCNPGAYAGRSHQTVLQDRGTRVHYPALSPEFLKEQVVLPTLNRIFQKTSLKGLDNPAARHAADRMMALQQQLKLLLPDRVFSPRDLTDACSWMAWQLHYSNGRVSKNQLDEMVWNAFDSVIAHSMYGETRESYQIVKLWFGHHYQIHQPIHKRPTTVQKGYDLRLDALYRKFCDYVTETKPEFDTSSQSVKSLMQTLAQDLDRLCLEHETGVRHSGRRATLVEGPAGRGKDATLKLLLDMWQAGDEKSQPAGVRYFNAGDCDWTELKKAIREAQQEGKVLVVSELNMISSADLEGELNDVLTEPCAPGFHLFATTNPPEYSGRSAFSPALNDRFRMVRIDDYHQQELIKIARQKLPPESRDQTAEHIAALHCYIHKRLKGSGQALFPVCRDLQNLAAAATPRSDLADLFSQHYFLYMEAGKITKEEVAEFLQLAMQQQQPHPVKSHRYDHTLCNWLFKTIPSLDRPIFIQRSKSSGFGVTQTRELVIDEKLSDSDAKREVIKRTVQWLWRQETDMPDEMGGWSDTESKSLYVMQKRQWFSTRIKSSEILPSDVFRLSGRQSDHQALQVSAGHREALKHLAGYRHILSEREIWERLLRGDLKVDIDKPASVWKACMKSACLPVAAMCCLPVHALSQCSPDLRTMAGEKLDGNVTYVPRTKKTQRKPVETGKVSRYGGGLRPIRRERTFYGEDINNYRLKFYRYKVTDNGNIYKTQLKPGKKDLIRVFPAAMVRPSANDVVQLYHGEAYGCHTINTGFNHQLLPLPGRFPREEVRALRTVPVRNYELFQDSYTGQHWIKFSGLTCKRPVQVHYKVEQKHSSAGLVEVASVNKVHHPQPVETQEQDNVCCLPAALFRRDHHQRGDSLVIPESNHCPEPIRYRVDNLFNTVRAAAETSLTELTNNQRLVLDIVNATDDSARIEAAADYCRQFDNESYRKITGSDDLAQILLSEAVGTCRHRTPVFKFILQYFGITCRIVESEIHAWAEVWNGYDWETYDLGGGDPDVGDDIHGYNPYFPKIRVQQFRERQTGKNSLAVLAPEVIEHFKKANPEGIKQGCERLSTCKQYDGFFWEQQRQVTDSLLASLNQMAESGSDACIQVVGDIEHAQNCLDAPRQYDSSEKMWGFLKSVLKDHLKHCVEKNVTNTGWCSVLAAFVVQKKWLEPETESSHGLFENLRQWRWIEANIPPLKTLASRMIEYWYKLWRHSERTINISRRYTEQLNAMMTEIDEDTVPTGCSETFETLLGAAAKFEQWTDQPEDGIPDVSRLLQGIPAYRKVASSQSQAGKPLFLLPNGFIDTRNQPEETQTRFAHYLYKRTQALKAPMCIGLAGREHFIFKPFQVVKPTSTVHVKNLLLNYDKLFVTDDPQWITRQKDNIEVLENTRIKKMMDCEDLVIIRPEDLQKIYDEYIESLGVSS